IDRCFLANQRVFADSCFQDSGGTMPPDNQNIPGDVHFASEPHRDQPGDESPGVSRRGLMQLGGAAAVAAAIPVAGAIKPTTASAAAAQTDAAATPIVAEGDALPPAIPPWMQEWGPLPSEYGSRSIYEEGVV